eukprot:605957-Amphidinium_carterae.1
MQTYQIVLPTPWTLAGQCGLWCKGDLLFGGSQWETSRITLPRFVPSPPHIHYVNFLLCGKVGSNRRENRPCQRTEGIAEAARGIVYVSDSFSHANSDVAVLWMDEYRLTETEIGGRPVYEGETCRLLSVVTKTRAGGHLSPEFLSVASTMDSCSLLSVTTAMSPLDAKHEWHVLDGLQVLLKPTRDGREIVATNFWSIGANSWSPLYLLCLQPLHHNCARRTCRQTSRASLLSMAVDHSKSAWICRQGIGDGSYVAYIICTACGLRRG